ncbi:Galectin [Meloidogyne graminicola]|uniref:Galectin n=1 Tax=Meloidogyne graminicola TaxID=189291 RepID=A0A8S9ZTZ9_9BILA|nr:Galectin [Meloidogyne graminicola]
MDVKNAEGEFLFHFNPRFGENCVVRSSTKDGQHWQNEEREGGMPFSVGKPFLLEMLIEENGISCSVNGNQFCFFKARDNLETATSVEVLGDVLLNDFNVTTTIGSVVVDDSTIKTPRETDIAGEEEENPLPTEPTHPIAPVPGPQGQLPIPYQAPLDTLLTTNRMRIVGTPHLGAQRFTVNWKSSEGETLFHFNTRFDPGKQFALDFLLHGDIIRARDDLHKVVLLDIHGDISLDQVLIA